ncbi:hypothetical protein PHET_12223 [Paragonimus heterotremus]|uniref:Uncharacterized protein n=1 Tax=Paragonimus heterotremus TaxID=100268 RepID=A0A8J4SY12_9TREM|nr:hypothetical protein PHET_12223 [Paragonimus heterotremus]
MPKSRSESGKTRRKCPKRCTLAIYHTGAVILFVGIVVAIIGIATSRLFHVYVYDHRKPARFLNLHIPVGLFSLSGEVTWLSLEQEPLPHALELDGKCILMHTPTMIIHLPVCCKITELLRFSKQKFLGKAVRII